jgi:hypothetical protein
MPDLMLPCVIAGEAEEKHVIAVDACTPAKPTRQTLAPACKLCNCHHLLRPRLDQFRPSPDLNTLGKHLSRKTLASARPSRAHAAARDYDDGRPSIIA